MPTAHSEPLQLFVPGPRATDAGHILTRMRDTAQAAFLALRYVADESIDVEALEQIEDMLDQATRRIRHAEREHTAAWSAATRLAMLNTDQEETTSEAEHEP